MRTKFHTLIAVLLILLAYSSIAQAYPSLQDGTSQIKFYNAENWIDSDLSYTVSIGDIFYGIAWATTFNLTTQSDPYWTSTGSDNLSAYFLIKVTDVTPSGNAYKITFGAADSDPNNIFSIADLSSGVVQKLFSDNDPLDMTNTTTAISSVIDGNAYATLSIIDGYWYALGLIDPSSLGTGGYLATNYNGLDALGTFGGYNLDKTINPPVTSYGPQEVVGQSNIYVGSDFDGWMFTSSDPYRVTPTPEPATMLIVGSGLVGMFAIRRRSKRS